VKVFSDEELNELASLSDLYMLYNRNLRSNPASAHLQEQTRILRHTIVEQFGPKVRVLQVGLRSNHHRRLAGSSVATSHRRTQFAVSAEMILARQGTLLLGRKGPFDPKRAANRSRPPPLVGLAVVAAIPRIEAEAFHLSSVSTVKIILAGAA
jgi:hypothetical protein